MKKAMAVVSFGVGNAEVKARCIDALVSDIRAAFGAEFDIYEAWTSSFLRKKMLKAGCEYPSLEELLELLANQGYAEVIVMPTHFTAGEEYQKKLLPAVQEFAGHFTEASVMKPIFAAAEAADFCFLGAKAEVLGLNELREGEELVLMGHGSPHQHNMSYELLQEYTDSLQLPVHIGVVEREDSPNQADVIKRLQQRGVKKVFLKPFLLAGGAHAAEDLAGDAPDSWKNVLQAAGIEVRYTTRGMAESPAFRALYLTFLQNIM